MVSFLVAYIIKTESLPRPLKPLVKSTMGKRGNGFVSTVQTNFIYKTAKFYGVSDHTVDTVQTYF